MRVLWVCCALQLLLGYVEGQHNHRPRYGCPPTVSPYPTETGAPSPSPSEVPTISSAPTVTPQPTATESEAPTITPLPTGYPTESPAPSPSPSEMPSLQPTSSSEPSFGPSAIPTKSIVPSSQPSSPPSSIPSANPSFLPTVTASEQPTASANPSAAPSQAPSIQPTSAPSIAPTLSVVPSSTPIQFAYVAEIDYSKSPTISPSSVPSDFPSLMPSTYPSSLPTLAFSNQPSTQASNQPTVVQSSQPSSFPSSSPQSSPSTSPSFSPGPSGFPSFVPTEQVFAVLSPVENKDSLSASPSMFGAPTAPSPTGDIDALSASPSRAPSSSRIPSDWPSLVPSKAPTDSPSGTPVLLPSSIPSDWPSLAPTSVLSNEPTLAATEAEQGAAPQLLENSLIVPIMSAQPSAAWSTAPTGASNATTNNTSPGTSSSSSSANANAESNSTMEKYIMVTAVSSVVLENQNSTLDLQRIAIFESIALGFLTHHYTHAINNNGIEFTKVTIVDQVPKTYPVRRNMEEDYSLDFVDEARRLPFAIDIEIIFEVVGTIFPDDGFVFMDFQWLVETLFDVNLEDFHSRLEKTGEFQPISIQGEPGEPAQSTKVTESNLATGSQFNTWMIASIGAVVLSVFLTAVLITGATRRARRQRLGASLSDSREYGSSASPLDHDLRSRRFSPSVQSGVSLGYDEESLDGLKLVRSDSKSAVSTLGASIKGGHGSIFIPVKETNDILRQLSNDNQEKDKSLNARMRKRLIKREIRSSGYQAGLSMHTILQATSSFNSEEEERHHGLTISVSADGTENPSPVAVPLGSVSEQRNAKDGGIFSTWFGRKRGHKMPDEDSFTKENSGSLTLGSPYQQSYGDKQKRESTCMSLPSRADVITVGESIREEHPMSTMNWNDAAPKDNMEQGAKIKRSPFKSLGNAALRVIGRGEKTEPPKNVQLSDEYDDDYMQDNVSQNNLSALRGLGAIRSTKHMQGLKSDKDRGFVDARPKDLNTPGSRQSSLSSFPISPHRFSISSKRKQSVGDSTAASSWKRPGKIKTEFQSSPLQRRLARARADPPVRLHKAPLKLHLTENETHDGFQEHQEDHRHQYHESNAPGPVQLHRPHSKVHPIKKGSKLSKVRRHRVPNKVEEYTTSVGGRIGAAPMIEMNVASNRDATILGSVEENGLELEWGMTI